MELPLLQTIFIVLNILLIEVLLSVDNSAALAVMVKVLPKHQQGRALKYGIFGAFFFRGVCLFTASFLIKFLWLKILGGLYLVYLAYDFFKQKKEAEEGDADKTDGMVSSFFKRTIGLFWGTVVMVEIMDLSLSIDNVLAVVALTPNIYLVILGVIIGIIAMRFVAQRFVAVMEKYPELEATTFVVIALLGLKLILSGAFDYTDDNIVKTVLNHHATDMVFSIGILVLFLVPVLKARLSKNNEATMTLS